MSDTIQHLTIEGFKSIRNLRDFEFRPINVLIGANGAGKSNFVGFFRLLRELIEQRLQLLLQKEGGADSFLYLGPKVTKRFVAKLYFGNNGYEFALEPTADNRLVFAEETTFFKGQFGPFRASLGSGHVEAQLPSHKDDPGRTAAHGVEWYVFNAVSNWVVYHFHDTSETADVRRQWSIHDNVFLRPNAANLAAYLYRIRETNKSHYEKIRDVVRLAAPFFHDFYLRPIPANPELIQLEWQQKDSDYLFRPSQLSDGTLRFICLATALLQPSLPATVFFDEPELGLHPYALTLLANLFKQAVKPYGFFSNQMVVSTQSAPLLNEFLPEDVVIVERAEGESTFRRLDPMQLSEWLEDYGLGELWQKNVLGGRPRGDDTPQLSSVTGEPGMDKKP
jgi:predicted ATPase